MIRHYATFFKAKNNIYSEIELFLLYMSCFCPEKARCPSCGAKGYFSPHGSYVRDLITYQNGVIISKIVIVRYICNSCGSIHAALSDMLMPYSSYSFVFVLTVLRAYFSRGLSGDTVLQICNKYQISVSALYAWKERFHSHKSLWLGVIGNLTVTETDFLAEVAVRPELSEGFFNRFGFSFLQNRKASNSGIP
jgi:transposase-like protein